MNEAEVITSIRKQIDDMEIRRVEPKFIILGENNYLAVKDLCSIMAFNPWPVKIMNCFLVIDPADKFRPPLVVADPMQEILMKVKG